jgi:hypothetical protein
VPGSFVNRPPGSCPTNELDPVIQLAATIRLAGPDGDGICALMTQQLRYNTQRTARSSHSTCGRAAIASAGGSTRTSQPLAGVLLNSSSPGPPQWYGFLQFTNPLLRSNPGDPRYEPLTIAIVKQPDGRWEISVIGYQF